MTSEFIFDSFINSVLIDGYRAITRTGQGTSANGIFSIGKSSNWNSFNDDTNIFTTANLTIGSLGGLLKATAGVVGIASSGTDYELPVTKGNLTESGSSVITFGGNTTNNVIGAGTTISIYKASVAQDGYLGKDDFGIFNGKMNDPMSARGDIIYRNASNVTARLPIGLDGYVLTSNGTDVIWNNVPGTISSDITYYVDGDAGSDSNDGLTWGTAKKTMAFLYSGDENAIPREISANVTIRCRGTILSKDTTRHTTIDGFYGSGVFKILGEIEDVVTGLVPTGFDNTSSSVTYRSYVEVDSATWTIDEYKGMFVQITNPSTDTICPIISNTATRIETTGLSISGENTFKIIKNLSNFKAATTGNPTVIINYPDYFMINTIGISIPLKVSNINTYDCGSNVNLFSTSASINNSSIISWYQNQLYITGCSIGFTYFGSNFPVLENSYINGSGVWFQSEADKLWIDRCAFVGTGAEGSSPIYLYFSCMSAINHTRITNYDIGIYAENAITLQMVNNLIESCNVGFNLNSSIVDMANAGFNRFKDNVTCVNLSGSTFKILSPAAGFYGSGNISEIVVADTPYSVIYSFSDIAAKRQIYNTRSGSCIVYFEDGEYGFKEKTFVEYDNTTSGLDSYFYQGAIDLLAIESHTPITLSASAVTGGLSLNTQEISFRAADTTYDGYLKSSDWDTFNGKQDVITKYNLSETASGILTITGGPSSVVTNAVTIQVKKASASQDGYLGKDNWTTFNSKGDMVLGSIQTNTAAKTFNDATLVLAGSSSGTTTLKANATAGTTTQTFQAVTGNVYCSGGTDVAYTDGGTGLSTYPTRTIILLAGGAALGTTTPATRETREMATNKQVVDVLKFAVAGVNIAWFSFPIPDAFDSGTFVITIQYFNATADSGKFVVFQAAMSAAADGEAIDVALGTTQVIKSSCSATNNFQKWTTFPAITASPTPAPSHMMFVKFWRDPTHSDDDSAVDVYVESIKVEFTANSWSD
jgi:hypothetical protein